MIYFIILGVVFFLLIVLATFAFYKSNYADVIEVNDPKINLIHWIYFDTYQPKNNKLCAIKFINENNVLEIIISSYDIKNKKWDNLQNKQVTEWAILPNMQHTSWINIESTRPFLNGQYAILGYPHADKNKTLIVGFDIFDLNIYAWESNNLLVTHWILLDKS